MTWTLPLVRLGRLRVQIHALFLVLALSAIGWSLTPWANTGSILGDPRATIFVMTSLLAVVLLREVLRALAVNRFGGEADLLVLWPLGLFNAHRSPPGRPARITCSLVPTFISVLAAAALWVAVDRVIPNDAAEVLNPLLAPDAYARWSVSGRPEVAPLLLWSLHVANLAVLLSNLLPTYPLDGARIVEAVAACFVGRERSARAAGLVGLVAGAATGVVGLGMANVLPAAVGGLCAWMSWLRFSQARFAISEVGTDPSATENVSTPDTPMPDIDAVLARVSQVGYENLSADEKEILRLETERRRRTS